MSPLITDLMRQWALDAKVETELVLNKRGKEAINHRKIGHLIHLAAENDERGLDALIALAVHNNRYSKG